MNIEIQVTIKKYIEEKNYLKKTCAFVVSINVFNEIK